MSALRQAIDTTTLGWIKPELDETLRQARHEIEAFAEGGGNADGMRACAAFLHQVRGTLRIVELYAPALVAEEMERLSMAVADGAVPDRDDACAALMRGVVLLPDYLERLQGGHKDIPVVLLATPKPTLPPSVPAFYRQIAEEMGVGFEEAVVKKVLTDRDLKSDLVHPNAEGYRLIAKALEKMLRRSGAV